MKQRMKEPYEKGIAIGSDSSLALGIARYSARRRQRIGGVGIQLRKDAIRTPTSLLCAEGNMNRRDSASSCSVRRSRRPQARLETSCTRTGRPRGRLQQVWSRRTAGEGLGHTARMYVCEESDSGIVPMNHSNKDGTSSAEREEGSLLIKKNTLPLHTYPP